MRKWIIILVIIIISAIFGYNYLYQDHRDIESETAEFSMTSSEIAANFSKNSTEAEKTFLNKTIEISGTLSEVNSKDFTVDDNVFCQFTNEIKEAIKVNSKIKVKGRVIGYDDLLEQVKLDQCAILK
jgi:predicted negative regulator of RcsB-dependent stress response